MQTSVLAGQPLVSAIMITGKTATHEALARLSVQSFLEQRYPHKELIIVNDGEYRIGCVDPRVREFSLNDRSPKLVLGALRNFGLKQVRGDFVVQWDDDDWHHPERISTQLAHVRPGGCTLLSRQIRCSLVSGAARMHKSAYGIHGTILHAWPIAKLRYPETARGEDSAFQRAFTGKSRVVLHAPEWLYLRFHHGYNTWSEGHIMQNAVRNNQWRLSDKAAQYLAKALTRYSAAGLLSAPAVAAYKRKR